MKYIILEGYPSDVQKKLNQWKSTGYTLTVLGQSAYATASGETWVVLIVEREEAPRAGGSNGQAG